MQTERRPGASSAERGLGFVIVGFMFRTLPTKKREAGDDTSGRREQPCPVGAGVAACLAYPERILAHVTYLRCNR